MRRPQQASGQGSGYNCPFCFCLKLVSGVAGMVLFKFSLLALAICAANGCTGLLGEAGPAFRQVQGGAVDRSSLPARAYVKN